MSVFDELPEHDYSQQDAALELLILFERFDEVDVIEDFPIITIDYGWSNYEEGEQNIVTIDVNTLEVTSRQCGTSCFGGDWDDTDSQTFDTVEEIFEQLESGLTDYYTDPVDYECSLN